MIQTDIPCRRCSLPMVGITFSQYYAIVCNNFGCILHRQPQGSIEREIELGPIKTFMPAPLFSSHRRGRIRKRGKKKAKVKR